MTNLVLYNLKNIITVGNIWLQHKKLYEPATGNSVRGGEAFFVSLFKEGHNKEHNKI